MKTLSIRTGEGVEFALQLAGPLTRALAWGLDFLLIFGLWMLLGQLSVGLNWIVPELATAILLIGVFLIPIIYHIAFEWYWRGQTPGKRVFKLRVVDADGMRLRPGQVILRNLLRTVDSLPALSLVGGLTCFFNLRSQRLGDLAANTVVIRIPAVPSPNLAPILENRANSFRRHSHIAARLRQKTPPALATLALQALGRRHELEPAARLQLFSELAARFKEIAPLPTEEVEALADEQFVRNAVDVIYRPHVTD